MNRSDLPKFQLLRDFIPSHLHTSPLLQRGGFAVFAKLIDPSLLTRLLSESLRLVPHAVKSWVPVSDTEEVRGGDPARRFLSAAAGREQHRLYQAAWLRDVLSSVAGTPLQPSGGGGTYTYYAHRDDYLTIHRDVSSCDVAVITCLHDGPEFSETGGLLSLYPTRVTEPLSQLRAQPEKGVVNVRLQPGHTIVLFGGLLPHAILPVSRRQVRIVSVLCYRDLQAEEQN
ncbi:MAG: hypothetical protein FJ147_22200 [Deltaproteobacteria bacterium]|nr:hypothetical protein [Deltaproteobacteria bacterium]